MLKENNWKILVIPCHTKEMDIKLNILSSKCPPIVPIYYLSNSWQLFFKLCINIDIEDEWCWIEEKWISFNFQNIYRLWYYLQMRDSYEY